MLGLDNPVRVKPFYSSVELQLISPVGQCALKGRCGLYVASAQLSARRAGDVKLSLEVELVLSIMGLNCWGVLADEPFMTFST